MKITLQSFLIDEMQSIEITNQQIIVFKLLIFIIALNAKHFSKVM